MVATCLLLSFDFENLDAVPEDSLVVFCVATYGEGEPTDNAVGLMDFLKEDDISFSKGGSTLENLHYVVFARTYFCTLL
jgi:NADPH-ferrihemoprotein reductase